MSMEIQVQEATSLISHVGEDFWVSSLDVAQKFKKEHRVVLAAAEKLQCTPEFRLHNFVQSSYVNEQDKLMPLVLMNYSGFCMLAMGFTGQVAIEWREAFIRAFKKVTETLQVVSGSEIQTPGDMLVAMAVRFRDLEREQLAIKGEIKQIVSDRQSDSVDSRDKRTVRITIETLGQKIHPKFGYSKAHKLFNAHFGLEHYDELPKGRFQEAIDWLKAEIDRRRPFTPQLQVVNR